MRKFPLVNGQVYHVITRSIAQYKVFNDPQDFDRITDMLKLYRYCNFTTRYSMYSRQSMERQNEISESLIGTPKSVEIIAYCIMPTHLHLAIKQLEDNGISNYISKVLNSYTKHFNCIHKRKGPLWEGRFKNILVDDNDQLLHLTRYIHLNPSSARLVDAPEQWRYSSYREYINTTNNKGSIASRQDLIDMDPGDYREFVEDRIAYQQELSKIKSILLDNYTG